MRRLYAPTMTPHHMTYRTLTYSVITAAWLCALAVPSARAQGDTPPVELDSIRQSVEELQQKVFELEESQKVHEEAIRGTIRDAFNQAKAPGGALADVASQINQYVVFGGTIEGLAGWSHGFDGTDESFLVLDTAELDFEVRVNEWSTGVLVVAYDGGEDFVFATDDPPGLTASVDRFTVDEAFVIIGDVTKFPPFVTVGRMILPFGISTGDPVVDVLTISDPLTIEIFETKEDAILLGFDSCGCNGGIYAYRGRTVNGGEEHIDKFGGTLGYRNRGFGWSFEADVDVNSSVFDSDFLFFEYRHVLEDGAPYIPGMAAHVKSSLGPFSLVAEWNGALEHAMLTDDNGDVFLITPAAWQVSMGYQFHWDPTMELIGAQGHYFAIGYSESEDMAGLEIGGDGGRRGFVPERRLLVTVGDWVFDGLRLAVEYGHEWDYTTAEGGTGSEADEVNAQMTFEW